MERHIQLDFFKSYEEVKQIDKFCELKDSLDNLRRGLFKRIGEQGKRIDSVEQLVYSLQVEIDRLHVLLDSSRIMVS